MESYNRVAGDSAGLRRRWTTERELSKRIWRRTGQWPKTALLLVAALALAGGQKLALASLVGTLSLMLRKAGETAEASPRRITLADLGRATEPFRDSRFITVGVTRAAKRQDYSVPVENARGRAVTFVGAQLAHQ